MLAPSVVSRPPLRVDNRPAANFDDAITRAETHLLCSQGQIDMGPLIAMIMDIVGDLAEQDPLGFEDPIRFAEKARIRM